MPWMLSRRTFRWRLAPPLPSPLPPLPRPDIAEDGGKRGWDGCGRSIGRIWICEVNRMAVGVCIYIVGIGIWTRWRGWVWRSVGRTRVAVRLEMYGDEYVWFWVGDADRWRGADLCFFSRAQYFALWRLLWREFFSPVGLFESHVNTLPKLNWNTR